MSIPKIIAVVGPTASGKTSLGVFLAQKVGGEVVSADSRQVYKGLNIGTGKVTKKEMGGIRHYLLDVVSPKRQFTADDFVKQARKALGQIATRGKVPLVVGGTGFYTDALLGRITLAQVPPNPALRAKLEKKSVVELFAMVKKLDPARAKTIEPDHKRRLIRAIEIAYGQSKKNSEGDSRRPTGRAGANFPQKIMRAPEELLFAEPNMLWLGLSPAPTKLKKNIHLRLVARIKQGMIAEGKRLHKAGLSYKRMEQLGLEYRYLARHLQGQLTKQEFAEQLERAINKYAKRQSRWFKRNQNIHWVKNKIEALRLAKEFLR